MRLGLPAFVAEESITSRHVAAVLAEVLQVQVVGHVERTVPMLPISLAPQPEVGEVVKEAAE